MPNRIVTMVGLAALALPMITGCATNNGKVLERGAADLSCEPSNVHVELTERPYVGVARYEASGCGETRSYECHARFYIAGVPMGERTCKRTGSPVGPVASPQSVVF
jgi:hypothetical protein